MLLAQRFLSMVVIQLMGKLKWKEVNMENIFKGCMPALMTPCNQDLSPNFDLLVKKADELMNYGMSAVIYCGSMGDWPLLTDKERQEGVSRLVKAGIPTIVGTGSINSKKSNRTCCARSRSGCFRSYGHPKSFV